MIFADYAAIALSIIGFLLALQGLWMLCRALWPNRVERSAERCRRNGLICFVVGVPVTIAVVTVAIATAKLGGTPGQLMAWTIATIFMIYAGTGMSGFVTHIGERLGSPADAARPWLATIRGGLALELACLLPVIGWVGLLPASLVLGAGAVTLSFFGPPRRNIHASLYANSVRPGQSQVQELPSLEPAEAMS